MKPTASSRRKKPATKKVEGLHISTPKATPNRSRPRQTKSQETSQPIKKDLAPQTDQRLAKAKRQLGIKSKKKPLTAAELTPKRLNKVLADSGLCSRREADRWIADGRVTVNFEPPHSPGQSVTEQDIVLVDGHPLPQTKRWFIAFHKPSGVITTRSDDRQRRTLYDVLPKKYHGCDPAGRLDKESSGLLILSNDGDFIHQLTHPRYACPKVYRVRVKEALEPSVVKALKKGIVLVDEVTGKEQLAKAQQAVMEDDYSLTITLLTGLNRQIRRSLHALGYTVTTLRRLAIGPVQLKSLPVGKARELSKEELRALKKLFIAPQ
ncbi:MAG: pseudouridine synthase [Vampirovibrionales bacterium]